MSGGSWIGFGTESKVISGTAEAWARAGSGARASSSARSGLGRRIAVSPCLEHLRSRRLLQLSRQHSAGKRLLGPASLPGDNATDAWRHAEKRMDPRPESAFILAGQTSGAAMPNENEVQVRYRQVAEGEFAGWNYWPGDHFEVHSGPFFFRTDADGTPRCAFRVLQKHLNGGGSTHGGCLLTFADYCLFVFAEEALAGSRGVTVSL